MRILILFGAIVVGMAWLISSALAADHTKDSLDAVKKAVADKAVLLAVREKSGTTAT